MSEVKTGILEQASERNGGFWSILVDGTWYGTWKDDHSALIGKAIIFDAVLKDGKYWNASKVRVDPNAPAQAAPAASGGGNYQDNRQYSIVLQSSYKTAAEIVCALVSADKLTMGAKKDALDITLGLVDEVAVRIYRKCINPLEFLSSLEEDGDPNPQAATKYDPIEA